MVLTYSWGQSWTPTHVAWSFVSGHLLQTHSKSSSGGQQLHWLPHHLCFKTNRWDNLCCVATLGREWFLHYFHASIWIKTRRWHEPWNAGWLAIILISWLIHITIPFFNFVTFHQIYMDQPRQPLGVNVRCNLVTCNRFSQRITCPGRVSKLPLPWDHLNLSFADVERLHPAMGDHVEETWRWAVIKNFPWPFISIDPKMTLPRWVYPSSGQNPEYFTFHEIPVD